MVTTPEPSWLDLDLVDRVGRIWSLNRDKELRLMNRFAMFVTTAAVIIPVVAGSPLPAAEELPPGVEQIIPRGQIAAVVSPRFVPAGEAKISDDAWVLGVEIDGQAHAYSLNLLNRHEVVNDRIGDTAFAAVW